MSKQNGPKFPLSKSAQRIYNEAIDAGISHKEADELARLAYGGDEKKYQQRKKELHYGR